MKKISMVIACAAALALGGCATGFGTSTPVVTPAGNPTVEAVQNTAATICGFVPSVTTVASIITTFTGGGAIADLAGTVARSICNAVVPVSGKKTLRRVAGPPSVNGVPVKGYFIAQ